MQVLQLIRDNHIYYPDRDAVAVASGDLMLVKGSANDLIEIIASDQIELPLAETGLEFGSGEKASVVVEIVFPPNSRLIGQRLSRSRLSSDPDIHIIAMQRRGTHYSEAKLQDIRLRTGDVLLIWCPESRRGA